MHWHRRQERRVQVLARSQTVAQISGQGRLWQVVTARMPLCSGAHVDVHNHFTVMCHLLLEEKSYLANAKQNFSDFTEEKITFFVFLRIFLISDASA